MAVYRKIYLVFHDDPIMSVRRDRKWLERISSIGVRCVHPRKGAGKEHHAASALSRMNPKGAACLGALYFIPNRKSSHSRLWMKCVRERRHQFASFRRFPLTLLLLMALRPCRWCRWWASISPFLG